MRFLVTAGNTREMIDCVRDWGNIFTGNTGYAIARELAEIGQVDLLTSNANHLWETRSASSPAITAEGFTAHSQLKELLQDHMRKSAYDAVFMTAAVADYRPIGAFSMVSRKTNDDGTQTWTVQSADAAKIRSTHPHLAILGEPTEKLVDLFRSAWGYRGLLVKFKLEVGISEEELKEIAQKSRTASGADYIVANTLEMVEGKNAGAWLLGDKTAERIARADLPRRLSELARQSNRSRA